MKTFNRDSTVRITAHFFDIDGNAINPSGANVSLRYHVRGVPTLTTYPMEHSENDWIYDWDSTIADLGNIEGHAVTTDPAPVSSIDFEFRLSGNSANRRATA